MTSYFLTPTQRQTLKFHPASSSSSWVPSNPFICVCCFGSFTASWKNVSQLILVLWYKTWAKKKITVKSLCNCVHILCFFPSICRCLSEAQRREGLAWGDGGGPAAGPWRSVLTSPALDSSCRMRKSPLVSGNQVFFPPLFCSHLSLFSISLRDSRSKIPLLSGTSLEPSV